MKKAFALLVVIVMLGSWGCSNHAKSNDLTWYDNLETAEQVAQKDGRPILVNFTGSDWCVWCKKLNAEVFSQDDFINYAKNNLVLVKIDFPENIPQTQATKYYNDQLAQQFDVKGYPTIILLKSDGTPIAATGYQEGGAAAYVQHLQSLL